MQGTRKHLDGVFVDDETSVCHVPVVVPVPSAHKNVLTCCSAVLFTGLWYKVFSQYTGKTCRWMTINQMKRCDGLVNCLYGDCLTVCLLEKGCWLYVYWWKDVDCMLVKGCWLFVGERVLTVCWLVKGCWLFVGERVLSVCWLFVCWWKHSYCLYVHNLIAWLLVKGYVCTLTGWMYVCW